MQILYHMYRLRRADIILTAILLVLSGALFFVRPSYGEASYVEVTSAGNGRETYPLAVDRIIEVEGTGNRIEIKDGSVRMTDTDCPDELCIRTGSISKSGQTIVCLPNRVTVRIVGEESGYDTIAR